MDGLIPSFSVDHNRIVPGIFTSRVDDVGGNKVTTYDIRMLRPNKEPAVDVAAMHSLEHVIATFLRNDPDWKDEIIYWAENVPGASAVNCGNYLMHNLAMAKWYAERFVEYLVSNADNPEMYEYPKTTRLVTEKGQNFYDS